MNDELTNRLDRLRVPLRAAYLALVLLATLSFLRLDVDGPSIVRRLGRMLDLSVSRRDIADGARNVALFAGWGLVWMLTARPGRSWVELRNAVVSGACASLFVESVQLLSDTRVASVLDVFTNTSGALLGALFLALLVRGVAAGSGARSYVGIPAWIFATAYAGAALVEALLPLAMEEERITTAGGPLARLATTFGAVRAESVLELSPGGVLLFLPAGAFAVAALAERGGPYRRSATLVSLVAAILLPLAQVAHGALGVEIHLGHALAHVGGVGLGAWATAWGLPRATPAVRGAARPRWVTAGYACVLAAWALRPFRPEISWAAVTAKLTAPWWVPLRSLGIRGDLYSVADVSSTFLLYLPVGALLAVWPLRRGGWLSGALPAICFAAAMELAQALIATRSLDVTDWMIAGAGAGVGWLAVRRAGLRPYGAQLP